MRIKGYSLAHSFYLIICLCFTKIFYTRFRLVRLPFRFRKMGALIGGIGLTIGFNCRIDIFAKGTLSLSQNIQLNDHVHIACADKISIGENVLVASRVYISDHDHDLYSGLENPQQWPLKTAQVIIGDNCWIGEGVCILKGVSIGKGSVIGANAVVTKSFPANSVIGGVPAKSLK
jgi:lipopolysaccharide O-acetyltransferase